MSAFVDRIMIVKMAMSRACRKALVSNSKHMHLFLLSCVLMHIAIHFFMHRHSDQIPGKSS